ncbi:hypothetical protein AHAS_Ahas08G0126300 [Arachis hypogaea]
MKLDPLFSRVFVRKKRSQFFLHCTQVKVIRLILIIASCSIVSEREKERVFLSQSQCNSVLKSEKHSSYHRNT